MRSVFLKSEKSSFYTNDDFSLFKNTLLTEHLNLQIRGEFYNVFNQVVFSGPAANINNPTTFGIIGGQANTPRLIQFAAKLIF